MDTSKIRRDPRVQVRGDPTNANMESRSIYDPMSAARVRTLRDYVSDVSKIRVVAYALVSVLAGLSCGRGFSSSMLAGAAPKPSAHSALPLSLESIDFSSPTTGMGVFTRESLSGDSCTDFIGKSSDGGANFSGLVRAYSWNCSNHEFSSSVASDDSGDIFLYGPQLIVSHNDGRTWSRGPYSGSVVDIDAVDRSIWMVRSLCTRAEIATNATCRTGLVESINGGRTWHSMTSPSSAGAGSPIAGTLQSYLVRVNRDTAYLMFAPHGHPNGSSDVAPLWFTTNGGVTWSNRQVPCHMDAGFSVFSRSREGALMTVCASGPSAGSQPKTVLTSSNGGRSWKLETPSKPPYSELDNGYLGSIDLISGSKAFLVGGRSSLLETRNGGRTWQAVQPLIGSSAGGTSEVRFFSVSEGLVLGNNDNDNERVTLWRTVDGGARWSVVIPKATA